jgi:hypothetical protein
MLKYLRIAVTALCLSAGLLLFVLWVRSYGRYDGLVGPLWGNRTFSLSAAYGRVRYATFDKAYRAGFSGWPVSGWRASSFPIKSPPDLKLVNTPLTDLGFGFAHSSDRYGIVAVFPLWFPIILAVVLAAALWARSCPCRFSLRTLLERSSPSSSAI